jgi:hypothetical protein
MNGKTDDKDENRPDEKAAVTLSSTVEKIVPEHSQPSGRKRKSPWKARKTFTRKSGSKILFKMNPENDKKK